ncbi:MAG: glycoside hydrolase family 3 C-terminal domain-containing protein, partial [Bacteroidales bacterium]|nr:glycoside hydrolase family 3 C-terminal domain-containing protein [Bacteroidales bacterium]
EPHFGSFNSPEHYAAARKIAGAGTVLLQNNGILPLNVPDGGKLVVIGENAVKKMVVGGGSSSLKTNYEITPLEALQEAFPNAEVVWERGYVGDTSTSYNRVDTGQDLSESRPAAQLLADALKAIDGADAVIFIGGLNKSDGQDNEGTDRADTILPYGQGEVIEALAAAAPSMIVVNISGSPVSMPWADKVGAIVQGWYGGSETGHALVDVLTGAVNPSGKLPFTLPAALADCPLKTERQYPGIREEGKEWWQEYYDEGVFVGYRWYDTQGIPVCFPFGHGLSYTTFEYGAEKLSKAAVACAGSYPVASADLDKVVAKLTFTIKNTGEKDGAEVAQMYIAPPAGEVERPAKELRGFEKAFVPAGQVAQVSIDVPVRAFTRFDEASHSWVVDKGDWKVLLGSSSADIRWEGTLNVK